MDTLELLSVERSKVTFFSHVTAMVESMFDDMLRLIGFVDRKPEVVALICLNTY